MKKDFNVEFISFLVAGLLVSLSVLCFVFHSTLALEGLVVIIALIIMAVLIGILTKG